MSNSDKKGQAHGIKIAMGADRRSVLRSSRSSTSSSSSGCGDRIQLSLHETSRTAKMGSSWKLFTLTLYFCLAFTMVNVYGELVMLEHPVEDGTAERNYTCITEDDGASIIWYDRSKDWSELKESTSERPAFRNVRNCAIQGESRCLAKWATTSDWRLVNTAAKPTGPIFDYRFGELPEFQGYDDLPDDRYGHKWWKSMKVAEVNRSWGTLWFSGQKLYESEFGVLLCAELHNCYWLKISERTTVDVLYCGLGSESYGGKLDSSMCGPRLSRGGVFWNPGTNTWMTFRLEWDTQQRIIEFFKGNNSEPLVIFTYVNYSQWRWDTVSTVGVTTRKTGPRLRFHFHDYYFTNKQKAVISTKPILHSGEMFCAELLVALCPRCMLEVTMVNQSGAGIETWLFSGDKQNPYNRLLRWQLVKLNTHFDSDIPRYLSLVIKTFLHEDVAIGEWAIDNFRMCQSGGRLKESKRLFSDGVQPVCQKLSPADNHIVESSNFSHHTVADPEVISGMQKFLHPPTRQLVGRGGYIISQSGYICDRGFTGSDCDGECDDGFYGFECTQVCGYCSDFVSCNKSTGFCDEGCDANMIGPYCKTVFVAPTVEDVEETTATTLQSLVLGEEEVLNEIEIQVREADGESWTNFTANLRDPLNETSFVYEAHITGLKPNTVYMVRSAVSVETELTFGPEFEFTTRLGTSTNTEEHNIAAGSEPNSAPVHRQDQMEAPTVVNVTTSSARIIQTVKRAGYDGQIFVFFILRDLSSNVSFALLPTTTTWLEYELHAENLRANSLYKVYALVTLLASDRAVILDSSPITFETQCLDEIDFELTQSQGVLTIDMLLRPEKCDHPENQTYTVILYDIALDNRTTRPPPVSKFPLHVTLSSDTEYQVKIWIGLPRDRRLVFTSKIRTPAEEKAIYEDYI